MSTVMTIVLVAAMVFAAGLLVWLGLTRLRRRQQPRDPEYDITPLSPAEREGYAQQWTVVQTRFVDHPDIAVAEADRLVAMVMGERGYPTGDYQQQVADLSVKHARTLGHYRSAHDIKTRHDEGQVSTEELRKAMVHYRSLFEDLLDADVDSRTGNVDNAGRGDRHPGT
jgi:hypothetical protein